MAGDALPGGERSGRDRRAGRCALGNCCTWDFTEQLQGGESRKNGDSTNKMVVRKIFGYYEEMMGSQSEILTTLLRHHGSTHEMFG